MAEHRLQVDARQVAGGRPDDERQQSGENRDGEHRIAEQGEVQQRFIDPPLTVDEQYQRTKAGDADYRLRGSDPVGSGRLHRPDEEQQSDEREQQAGEVDPATTGHPHLSQEHGCRD
ncbi:hypothetical protein QLH51_05835 [Sphingomonas sp. 2R-10]|uniref:hypothetical protein n=1 Tax=Sphingomonas sp. 2R-10 TaxID=3045148 RepID=UPI000F77BCC7|nr:hypothetical protein [Sphingomonas sp. 2R-10]MDJ0276318.1 hypothetical protein [Sphingomonas sp. 2R-10]